MKVKSLLLVSAFGLAATSVFGQGTSVTTPFPTKTQAPAGTLMGRVMSSAGTYVLDTANNWQYQPISIDQYGQIWCSNCSGGVGGTVTQGNAGTATQAWFVTPGTVTPAAPDISTVTTGGTAVNAFAAGHCTKGCLLINPSGATQPLVVNGVSTASGTVTSGANIAIQPGGQYVFTARTTAISAISSDSLHTFGGEGYQ